LPQVLSVSNNSIFKIPHTFGNLKELRVVKLGSNSLFDLPNEFCKLPKIEEIQLYGNEMPRLPVSLNVRGHKEATHLLSLLAEYFPPVESSSATANVIDRSLIGLLSMSRSAKHLS
jgi:Leucine-rich repeat (LRR) protein